MNTKKAVSIVVAVFIGALSATSPASAGGDKDCDDFKNRKEAQKFFKKAGGPKYDPHRLDEDGDGKACETTEY